MKVLVTGGAGFLGSHLCAYLVNEGYDVVALDNLYTGSMRNLKPLAEKSNFRFVNGDVTEPVRLKFDQVFKIDPIIAELLFDSGVNMGCGTAIKFLQRSLNVLNLEQSTYQNIDVDGNIGAITLSCLIKFIESDTRLFG